MVGSVDEGHTVDVMHVAVFPVAVVNVVFWHSGFWSVEDGGFIHVIPDKGICSGASER